MSEPTIRWGILGAGGIASTFAPDITATDGNAIAAVAARDGHRAAAFAREHDIPRSYGSYDELVADPDVDVVYVATTHAQHRDHALLALHAGKPVLVEKAFALNARQGREIVDAARDRGLFCMEGMWMRLHPLIRQAVEIATSGRIGDLIGMRADLSKLFPYDPAHRLFDPAVGGGALLDLGVYPVTATYLFLGRPDTVQATASYAPTGVDLTDAIQWGFADGRVAQIYCSAAGPSPFAAVITGTGGSITLEPRIQRARTLIVRTDDGEERIEGPAPEGNGFRTEIAEVARCLRAGETESPHVPLDETIEILEVLDEIRGALGVHYPGE